MMFFNIQLPRCHNRRILIVEDRSSDAELMRRAVEDNGYEAWVVSSAEAANGALFDNGKKFCMVVADVGLGMGISGWQLQKQVSAKFPRMPFVIVSGSGESFIPCPPGDPVVCLSKTEDFHHAFRRLKLWLK